MSKPAASQADERAELPATTDSRPPTSIPELAQRMTEEAIRIGVELEEVELLITQARTEAGRHEARRAAASDKLNALVKAAASSGGSPPDTTEHNNQLVILTKRAALMESQVDVLEGKHRALIRYRDGMNTYSEAIEALPGFPSRGAGSGKDAGGGRSASGASKAAIGIGSIPPAVSRLLLDAQEDMRREIARAMHDGPAQSLTNIVLQAQIVDYLVAHDPAKASGEVRQLVAMVQQTLDAIKSFIFEVRPMMLDDLGLVPTLRRAARDHGRRAGIAVDFESLGQDRRLPMDLESGIFRIVDEALVSYLGAGAERLSLKLDWSDRVEATISAARTAPKPGPEASAVEVPSADLPPALREMMEARRVDAQQRAESAKRDSIVALPASTWREIQGRAATLGFDVALSDDGSELLLGTDLPLAGPAPG